MEFMYRAVDERRSRSPPPPPPAAPSTPGSGSADGHDSVGPAEHAGNSAVTLWRPDLPPPETAEVVEADELRRQAEKARIRERIVREEAEHWALELEVCSELREQMLQLSWPALGLPARGSSTASAFDADELRRQAEKARIRERILREEAEHWEIELEVRSELREQMLQLSLPAIGRPARGSGIAAAALPPGTITAADSSLPVVAHEAHPKASTVATVLTKRKSPDCVAGASTLSLAPSSKKQKSTSTCTVCGITANSEKAMQDHLNGKAHRKKVVALSKLPKLVPDEDETEQETGPEAGEEEAMAMETLGDYKPTKFFMVTAGGALSEVTQMDGYLLCELCNVRTADRVTMMCHLQGSKHISNDQKKQQPFSKPLGAAIANDDPNKKLLLEDYSVPLPHNVRRLEGFLHCELCDVKAAWMNVMHQHLSGKKHKNKANTTSDACVIVSSRGKEADKAQPIDTDHTTIISDVVGKVEAPLAKKSLQPKLGDHSELQEMTVAPPKEDVPVGTEMMKSSAASVGAQLNNVCDSDSLTMEVDNVMHPLRRVDGLLVCVRCNAKAPSENIMQSHLAGKKHKLKMTLAAARGNNDLSVLATRADDNTSKSTKGNVEAESAAPQAKNVANEEAESTLSLAVSQMKNTNAPAMASMAVDRPVEAPVATCTIEPAEEGEITEEAEEEHEAADSIGSETEAKESVTTNGTTAPVKPVKIQVEGKLFTVTQQENGRLSCKLCGIHGCDKDSMIMHLYTSTHWGKASLAEKKEERACMAAAATVDNIRMAQV